MPETLDDIALLLLIETGRTLLKHRKSTMKLYLINIRKTYYVKILRPCAFAFVVYKTVVKKKNDAYKNFRYYFRSSMKTDKKKKIIILPRAFVET